jgi:hypothetical protein
MKTFKQFMAEGARHPGLHSFGMEPSVDSYIKGLNAADERNKTETAALLKRRRGIKGGWGKPETKYGQTTRHGTGDYEHYSMTHKGDGKGMAPGLQGRNVHIITHKGSDVLGAFRDHEGYGGGVRAIARSGKYGGGLDFSDHGVHHKSKGSAIKHIIAKHKEILNK